MARQAGMACHAPSCQAVSGNDAPPTAKGILHASMTSISTMNTRLVDGAALVTATSFAPGSESGFITNAYAHSVVARYPPKAETVCFVDPEDKWNSVIVRANTFPMWTEIITYSTIFLCSFVGMVKVCVSMHIATSDSYQSVVTSDPHPNASGQGLPYDYGYGAVSSETAIVVAQRVESGFQAPSEACSFGYV